MRVVVLGLVAASGILLAHHSASAQVEGMEQAQVHNICWLEFCTPDLAAAKQFFGDVFGWQTEAFMDGYEVFTTPGRQLGGFSSRAPEGMQQTIPYIYVADLAAALAGIEAAGGKTVFGPAQVGEDGQVAMFTDPAGTLYGLADRQSPLEFSPDPFKMYGGDSPRHNSFCTIEMFGGDFTATQRFFNGQFGWICTETMPQYMAFNPGAGVSGVFQSHTPAIKGMAYLWSDDLDATVALAKAQGAMLIGDILVADHMPRFAYLTAPGGIVVGIIGK